MAKNLTTNAAYTIPGADRLLITVNAALTGTITVTVGGTTIATITNPAVGSLFFYGGLLGSGAIVVTPSTTCDITVTTDYQ